MRILIVSLPFSPFNPSSQLGVLAGHLATQPGIEVHTAHLFVHLAARLGLTEWETLSNDTAGTKVGNLLFQRLLFDRRSEPLAALLGRELAEILAEQGLTPPRLARWEAAVDGFWQDLRAERFFRFDSFDVFGCSTVFNQLFPSLTLAREVRRRRPDCRIVFGGVEVHGECGASVLSRFSFLDAVVEGRGERPLTELLAEYQAGRSGAGVGGVRVRDAQGQAGPSTPRPCGERPYFGLPDHTEFFATLAQAGLPAGSCTGIPVEASQGCYWRRCDFCGTRDVFPTYAIKDGAQIRQEVEQVVARHAQFHVIFTDEAVPVRRVAMALEGLAGEPFARHLALLAQIRATFKKEQIATLAAQGLRVAQVGIESFSSAVLARMDKGTTALQNIRCLKWCREHGVTVDYNLILGYPFATEPELRRVAELCPWLCHLDPPQPSDFYVNRFSLLARAGALPEGWTLRPAPLYNVELFPTELAGLVWIANEPVAPAAVGPGPSPATAALAAAMETWRKQHRPDQLYYLHGKEFLLVHDRRSRPGRTLRLDGLARELYLFLDDIRSEQQLEQQFGERTPLVRQMLGALAQARLVLQDGADWLALAPAFHGRVGWE